MTSEDDLHTMPRRKYRNQPVEVDGHRFASKAEARRYGELKLLMQAGKIKALSLQPDYTITINGEKICTYRGDFTYFDPERGKMVIEDVKGAPPTPVFKLKKKLMKACLGYDVTEIRY